MRVVQIGSDEFRADHRRLVCRVVLPKLPRQTLPVDTRWQRSWRAFDSEGLIRIELAENTGSNKLKRDLDEAWTPSEALQRYRKRVEGR